MVRKTGLLRERRAGSWCPRLSPGACSGSQGWMGRRCPPGHVAPFQNRRSSPARGEHTEGPPVPSTGSCLSASCRWAQVRRLVGPGQLRRRLGTRLLHLPYMVTLYLKETNGRPKKATWHSGKNSTLGKEIQAPVLFPALPYTDKTLASSGFFPAVIKGGTTTLTACFPRPCVLCAARAGLLSEAVAVWDALWLLPCSPFSRCIRCVLRAFRLCRQNYVQSPTPPGSSSATCPRGCSSCRNSCSSSLPGLHICLPPLDCFETAEDLAFSPCTLCPVTPHRPFYLQTFRVLFWGLPHPHFKIVPFPPNCLSPFWCCSSSLVFPFAYFTCILLVDSDSLLDCSWAPQRKLLSPSARDSGTPGAGTLDTDLHKSSWEFITGGKEVISVPLCGSCFWHVQQVKLHGSYDVVTFRNPEFLLFVISQLINSNLINKLYSLTLELPWWLTW